MLIIKEAVLLITLNILSRKVSFYHDSKAIYRRILLVFMMPVSIVLILICKPRRIRGVRVSSSGYNKVDGGSKRVIVGTLFSLFFRNTEYRRGVIDIKVDWYKVLPQVSMIGDDVTFFIPTFKTIRGGYCDSVSQLRKARWFLIKTEFLIAPGLNSQVVNIGDWYSTASHTELKQTFMNIKSRYVHIPTELKKNQANLTWSTN